MNRFLMIERIGSYSGVLAIIIFCTLYPIAAMQDPDYVFMANYLSDLGIGPGALAFNMALIMAGPLLSIFALFGLYPAMGTGTLSKIACISFAIAGGFLTCIGIFTEDFDEVHTFFSFAFFLTLLFTLGLMSLTMYTTDAFGRAGTMASVLSFISGACLIPLGANPFTETMAVLMILVWGTIISAVLLWHIRTSSSSGQ